MTPAERGSELEAHRVSAPVRVLGAASDALNGGVEGTDVGLGAGGRRARLRSVGDRCISQEKRNGEVQAHDHGQCKARP